RKIKSIERIIKKEFVKKEIPNGMEICEVQLMSLANKVHNTEINHEIDKYLININELFADTSKDELIKKFFSVEFTRFYNYYQKAKDLNVSEGRGDARDDDRDFGGSSNSTRYFINVGSKDGFDWMKLKDFLRESLDLGRDDIFKVETKDSFSFFNTENELKEKVLAYFTDFKHNGRFVNVEVSENRKGGGSGKRRERKRGGSDRRPRRSSEGDFKSNNPKGSSPKRSKKAFKSNEVAETRPRRSRR